MLDLKNIKIIISKNILYFIFSAYFILIFGIYFFSEYIPVYKGLINNLEEGYILGGDSRRYIRGASKILNFEMPEGKSASYLGYMTYIAIFQYLNLNLKFIVFSQIFLTFLSSLCIYKITRKFSSHLAAVIVLSLYLFYLPLQIWNFYILTETTFICSTIFILYFFIFFKKKYLPLLIFFIIFYITLRPHGVILIPSLSLSLLIWLYFKNKFRLFFLLVLCLFVLSFPTLSLLNYYMENEDIVSTVAEKGIIWGYDDKNNFLEFKAHTNIDKDLLSLLIFFKNNFYTFIIAFFKKLWFFNFRIRPYYSDFHNYYIIIYNLIYWPAAIFGIFKLYSKDNLGIILIYSLFIFFTLAVGFSWADWDGRFSLYILPLIFIFAGVGVHKVINLKK